MKVLILGGTGMLGHKACQVLASRFDVYTTVRRGADSVGRYGLIDAARTIGGVSADEFGSVVAALDSVQPAVVVNCIGIVKQAEAAKDPVVSISTNSLFPQRLVQLCQRRDIRLIHISTDCVFSGRKGNYLESDQPDAEDLYGRTKLLGEVEGRGCITLRTSMIGRELETSFGLVEWFLREQGKAVSGYKRAVFSGFTTIALSGIIARVISEHPGLYGVYHVAAEPISKYDLLSLVKQVYGLKTVIEPDETVVCDRSLNGMRFRQATGLIAPAWSDMIREMRDDPTLYARIRG